MPADAPEYVDPWRRCPGCATGRLVEGVKHLDPSKPSWRRFDCGHFVDDRERLNALMAPDFRKRYTDALTALCVLPPRAPVDPDRRAYVVEAVAEAFGISACACEDTYFCPTSGEVECPRHGGFDVCCDQTHLHTPRVDADALE